MKKKINYITNIMKVICRDPSHKFCYTQPQPENKTVLDSSHVAFYCINEFDDLKVYFKNLRLKDISYDDLNCLLKTIPPTHLLILRVFIRHINKVCDKEQICDTGFEYNYY